MTGFQKAPLHMLSLSHFTPYFLLFYLSPSWPGSSREHPMLPTNHGLSDHQHPFLPKAWSPLSIFTALDGKLSLILFKEKSCDQVAVLVVLQTSSISQHFLLPLLSF